MALINGVGVWIAPSTHQKTWAAVLNGDTMSPLNAPQLQDKTISVMGTFGAAGAIALLGSNDGVNWAPVHQAYTDTAISFTAAGLQAVAESPAYLQPQLSGADGTTNLTVSIVSVRRGAG
jgi:hypothetical protein